MRKENQEVYKFNTRTLFIIYIESDLIGSDIFKAYFHERKFIRLLKKVRCKSIYEKEEELDMVTLINILYKMFLEEEM
jgi:hypothetical protein